MFERDPDTQIPILRDAGPRDSGIVYFVQARYGGPIKIGLSTNSGFRSRLSSLQTGNPDELECRRMVAGGRDLERHLHELFRESSLCGEWFAPTSEICEMARALPDGLGDVEKQRIYQKGFDDGYKAAALACAETLEERLGGISDYVFDVYKRHVNRKQRAHVPPVELRPIRGPLISHAMDVIDVAA